MSSALIRRPRAPTAVPALFAPTSATAERVLEFFTANIRNPNSRKASCVLHTIFRAQRGFLTTGFSGPVGLKVVPQASLKKAGIRPIHQNLAISATPPTMSPQPTARHSVTLCCAKPSQP